MELNQIIGQIATVSITATITLLSVHLTNKHNLAKTHLELSLNNKYVNNINKRDKIEELYLLFDKWYKFITIELFNWSQVMNGMLTLGQKNELLLNDPKANELDFPRIEMLLNVYLTDLVPEFEKLRLKLSSTNNYWIKFRNEYQKGNKDGSKYINEFLSSMVIFDNSCTTFKNLIVKNIREYII